MAGRLLLQVTEPEPRVLEQDIALASQVQFPAFAFSAPQFDRYIESHLIADLIELCEEAQVEPGALTGVTLSAGDSESIMAARQYAKFCHGMGCPLLVLEFTPPLALQGEDLIRALAAQVEAVAQVSGRYDVRLALALGGALASLAAAWDVVAVVDRADVGVMVDLSRNPPHWDERIDRAGLFAVALDPLQPDAHLGAWLARLRALKFDGAWLIQAQAPMIQKVGEAAARYPRAVGQ